MFPEAKSEILLGNMFVDRLIPLFEKWDVPNPTGKAEQVLDYLFEISESYPQFALNIKRFDDILNIIENQE